MQRPWGGKEIMCPGYRRRLLWLESAGTERGCTLMVKNCLSAFGNRGGFKEEKDTQLDFRVRRSAWPGGHLSTSRLTI